MRKRKESLIMIIILLVLFLGVGYAYLTTTLSINGNTDVDANTWNVFWDNVQVTSGSVTGSQVITAPTISNQTTVSFHIRLKEPGEYYEFTVDAKNTGSIDAMIETLNLKVNGSEQIPDYLKFVVTYANGNPIEDYQLLSVGQTKSYKVRIEYRDDIDPSLLPSTNNNLPVLIETSYIQATSAAIPSPDYVYTTVAPYGISAGEAIPETITKYYNPIELIETTNYSYFLRHTMNNNIVEKIEVGFEFNDVIYYVSYDTPVEVKKAKMKSIFGESFCRQNYNMYRCSLGGFYTTVVDGGTFYAGENNAYFCEVSSNGNYGLCWND